MNSFSVFFLHRRVLAVASPIWFHLLKCGGERGQRGATLPPEPRQQKMNHVIGFSCFFCLLKLGGIHPPHRKSKKQKNDENVKRASNIVILNLGRGKAWSACREVGGGVEWARGSGLCGREDVWEGWGIRGGVRWRAR